MENIFTKKMKLLGVLYLLLSALSSISYADEIENPYLLIRDDELLAHWPDIEDFWKTAHSGELLGLDGITHSYRSFIHPQEKAAITIISGRAETYLKYKEVIFNFYQQGYSVYIYDHRGQGFSGRMTANVQQGHVWNFEDYVLDLNYFYKQIIQPNQHENLYLLGYSMGGTISSLYMQHYPLHFNGVVLVSPMHQPLIAPICTGANLTKKKRDFLIRAFGMQPRYAVQQGPFKFKEFKENDPSIMTHSELRFDQLQSIYQDNEQVRVGGATNHWLANACNGAKESVQNADKIIAPVLVLQAENDIAVRPQGQDKFCHNLLMGQENQCDGGSPQIIKGAYHEMLIESDPYRLPLLTRILDFLGSHNK